jgi:hypothetical protein
LTTGAIVAETISTLDGEKMTETARGQKLGLLEREQRRWQAIKDDPAWFFPFRDPGNARRQVPFNLCHKHWPLHRRPIKIKNILNRLTNKA